MLRPIPREAPVTIAIFAITFSFSERLRCVIHKGSGIHGMAGAGLILSCHRAARMSWLLLHVRHRLELLHFHEGPSQLLILYEQIADPLLQASKPGLPLFLRIFRRGIADTINWNCDRSTFCRVDRRDLREWNSRWQRSHVDPRVRSCLSIEEPRWDEDRLNQFGLIVCFSSDSA